MEVASLELCKELYGWSGTSSVLQYWVYQPNTGGKRRDKRDLWRVENIMRINEDYGVGAITDTESFVPAYDLGYLMRKLPEIRLETWHNGHVVIKYYTTNGVPEKLERLGKAIIAEADTPEDAGCKLAIELFKHGILQPNENDGRDAK